MLNDRIKSKIQKLLALAEDGSNSAESKSALRKAVLLMRKHELESGDIRKEDFVDIKVHPTRNRTTFHPFEKKLYWGICQAVGVLGLNGTPKKQGWRMPMTTAYFKLVGHESDIELVKYIFAVVSPQIEYKAREWVKERKASPSEKNNYMRGLAEGFAERLKNQMRTVEQSEEMGGTGLVPVNTKYNDAEVWFAEQGGKISTTRLSHNGMGGYSGGFKDSNSIRYNKGVKGSQAAKRLN